MTRACLLALSLACTLHAQPETLGIHAIGAQARDRPDYVATYEAGSRATSGILIEITNLTTRQPVEGAIVTLQMPSSGPSGVFRNGTKTEILTAGSDGKIEAWGMLWSATQGAVAIRISAAHGPDRATSTTSVLLTTPKVHQTTNTSSGNVHGHKKLWIAIAAVGGASFAVAGLASRQGSTSQSTTTPPPSNPTIVIGAPTIVITRPSVRQ